MFNTYGNKIELSFKFRYLRIRYYLNLYNKTLRHCQSLNRQQEIIRYLNSLWEKLSSSEQLFIRTREEW